ncbi:zinc finger protein [Ascosphaera apis ARSEF 7405]|uniref:Zinc finger protein n=1 Tax=Ascosphaera apis ARSEF 7405 TaxID=392613 RepID=A0A167WLK8_9EURO|nr:zinc finger protein [Ascosphaera apis ARSEF 7405]
MPTPDPQQHQSFSQLPDHDLESIGRNCEFEYCRQLDFLPFRCESCSGTFCLDHRTETAHHCPHAGEWAKTRHQRELGTPSASGSSAASTPPVVKPTVYNSEQCSHPSCKSLIHTLQTGVHCPNCNRDYCLKHRLKEDHDCANLVPIGARPASITAQAQAEKAKSAFARLRAWGKEKSAAITPKPKPSSTAQKVAALNTLKRTAKGDAKVSPEKRIYVHVEASSDTTSAKYPKGEFYFDKNWSCGKVLDDAGEEVTSAEYE